MHKMEPNLLRTRGRDGLSSACVAALVYLAGCATGGVYVGVSDGPHGSELVKGNRQRQAHALEELVASCSVDATAWMDPDKGWQDALMGPYIVARYVERPSFDVAGRRVSPSEILVPVPSDGWPGYFFVREGPSVMAFTKYRPERLAELVCDGSLGLPDHLKRAYLDEVYNPANKPMQADRPPAGR